MWSSSTFQPGVFSVVLCLVFHVRAQNSPNSDDDTIMKPLRPSLAVVFGIVSVMISLTFLVLAYAKFCHRYGLRRSYLPQTFEGPIRSGSTFSGIERTVIDLLPFFRFSSLKGSKEGLECAVCLSKFEDSDVLRLLPKCRHGFHTNCIDQWLEIHSSCPLCRYKFDLEDLNSFTCSSSFRYLRSPSNLTQDPNIELFIEREQEAAGSSRFSFRTKEKGKSDELLVHGGDVNHTQKILNKFKHKIIVSDVVVKNRWSDVNSSDLLSLNSEMLGVMSSNRFSPPSAETLSKPENLDKIKEDMFRKRLYESKISAIDRSFSFSASSHVSALQTQESSSKLMNHNSKRSMSEIVNFSRFRETNTRNRTKEYASPRNGGREERIRRVWLPMARKTVQWFAGGGRRTDEVEYRRQDQLFL